MRPLSSAEAGFFGQTQTNCQQVTKRAHLDFVGY